MGAFLFHSFPPKFRFLEEIPVLLESFILVSDDAVKVKWLLGGSLYIA